MNSSNGGLLAKVTAGVMRVVSFLAGIAMFFYVGMAASPRTAINVMVAIAGCALALWAFMPKSFRPVTGHGIGQVLLGEAKGVVWFVALPAADVAYTVATMVDSPARWVGAAVAAAGTGLILLCAARGWIRTPLLPGALLCAGVTILLTGLSEFQDTHGIVHRLGLVLLLSGGGIILASGPSRWVNRWARRFMPSNDHH